MPALHDHTIRASCVFYLFFSFGFKIIEALGIQTEALLCFCAFLSYGEREFSLLPCQVGMRNHDEKLSELTDPEKVNRLQFRQILKPLNYLVEL